MYAYLVTTQSGTRYYVTEWEDLSGQFVAGRTVTRDGDLMAGSCGSPIICENAVIPDGPVVGERFVVTLTDHPDRGFTTSPVTSVAYYNEATNTYEEGDRQVIDITDPVHA